MRKRIVWILAVAAMIFAFAGCDNLDYKKAAELYDEGNYQEAAVIFGTLGDYKDSTDKAVECQYMYAVELFHADRYQEALDVFSGIPDYEDVSEWIREVRGIMMWNTYSDQIAALGNDVWFYEASASNAVNVIRFEGAMAYIRQIYYDGNGPHRTEEIECPFEVDDNYVTVSLEDGSDLVMAYTFNGDEISFGNKYFTPEQVKEGLIGYWGVRERTYNEITGFSTNEYIYYYTDRGEVKFESAATAYGYNDGTYHYYGIYEGTYKVTNNGLEVTAQNIWQFGFFNFRREGCSVPLR